MKTAMGRPIASDASVCPPAKHLRIASEMQVLFPAPGVFIVVFALFLTCFAVPGHVPAACTCLKKMQAIACVKIGCPGHRMAVLSAFCYSFFCHLGPHRICQDC